MRAAWRMSCQWRALKKPRLAAATRVGGDGAIKLYSLVAGDTDLRVHVREPARLVTSRVSAEGGAAAARARRSQARVARGVRRPPARGLRKRKGDAPRKKKLLAPAGPEGLISSVQSSKTETHQYCTRAQTESAPVSRERHACTLYAERRLQPGRYSPALRPTPHAPLRPPLRAPRTVLRWSALPHPPRLSSPRCPGSSTNWASLLAPPHRARGACR